MTIASDLDRDARQVRWTPSLVSATESLLLVGGAKYIEMLGVDFQSLPISPYLACVILMAAQHGLVGGVFAATLATTLVYAGMWPAPALGQSYFDFVLAVSTEPLVWLVTGLAVGIITSRQARIQTRTADALKRSLRAQLLIEQQYNILAARARKLERKVAGLDSDDELTAPTRKRRGNKHRRIDSHADDQKLGDMRS